MKTLISRLIGITLLLTLSLSMTACGKADSPKSVAKQFWEAVQQRDMEAAKVYATWDTVDYLKYLKGEKLNPERFELGEQMLGETRSEVATTLFTSKMGKTGVKVPGVTVLIKTKYGWRVNVKKTMTSVVKHTANNVFDQLSGLMQEGIKELDSSLSDSMNELGRALEESAEELKRELSRPLFNPNKQNLNNHSGQQI